MASTRDETKLRELIVYVAARTADDASCGAVKFNKILYHVDFRAYLELGQSITGAEYLALEMGPAPRRLMPLRHALITEGAIKVVVEPGEYGVHRTTALRPADVTVFSADELALIETVLAELRPRTARQLSDASHETPGYRATELGSVIPYESAFVSNSVSAGDLEAARGAAQRLGL